MIPYENVNKEMKVVAVSVSGNMLFLEDGSRWEVHFAKKTHTEAWHQGDQVCITEDRGFLHAGNYKIKNVNRGEIADGLLLFTHTRAPDA